MKTQDETFLTDFNAAAVHALPECDKLPRYRRWTYLEDHNIIALRKEAIPLIGIATCLNRDKADVDLRLAQLGFCSILKGASPALVMEKLAFSALAYQRVLDHHRPHNALGKLGTLADDLKGTYGDIKCANGRTVVSIAVEMCELITYLEPQK